MIIHYHHYQDPDKELKDKKANIHDEYTIYCAVESVSDVCVYKMFDENGKEVDITISAEDDTEAVGKYSLIDCLYCLKHEEDKGNGIIIEEMTDDEMERIFGR